MQDPADDVGQLRARVERLDAHVTQLEDRIQALEGKKTAVQAEPPATQLSSGEPQLEQRLGLGTINRIGAFTLSVGIIFFFKYAVDNEWIGAAGRVLAGVVSGLLLIAAAEWLNRPDRRTFSQGLAGCGTATLYISLYSAFAWYKLISQPAAFFALVAICSLSVALSFRYLNPAIAALGFLGGLLTPILLHRSDVPAWPDLFYLFLLDSTCVVIALRRGWAALIPGIGIATIFAAWVLFDSHYPGRFAFFAFALAALHAVGAAKAPSLQPIRNALYLMANGCFILAILRELELWTSRNISPINRGSIMSELDSIFLVLYGIAALSYGIARASTINRSLALFLLGSAIMKLYLWDVWFLERFFRTLAFISLGVLLLAASWIYSRSRPRPGN